MRTPIIITAALVALFAGSCVNRPVVNMGQMPQIWPDYVGVTVPDNLAAPTFRMADGRACKWSTERRSDTVFVTVTAKGKDCTERYDPFPLFISHDPIDPYIAYRLIEPNYESWREMGLYYRELATYKEEALVTNQATGGGCVNCHTFSPQGPSRFLFHARGKGGGTVFVDDGKARILNLATVGPRKQGVYPAWHPGGRYVAFSSNSTHQSFPVSGSQEIEVYDTMSDLILMDTYTDSIMVNPALSGGFAMETFPSWSPDGSKLYFCRADSVGNVAAERAKIHYALMSVAFDGEKFTGEPEVLWESETLSVSFPRVNGKWLMFTASAYGTFPIWHREADLWLLNLENGEAAPAREICSPDTESYHSWSSGGRWVVFSSRRDDGRYTRLYLSHFDGEGNFTKPFLLPQKSPSYNDWRLKSYNIPEFVTADPGSHNREVSKLFKSR